MDITEEYIEETSVEKVSKAGRFLPLIVFY